MRRPPKMETRSGMIAKEVLKECGNDWLSAALKMFQMAKDDHNLMREIVDPIIADRVYEALERISPINYGGKTLLTCPLTTCEFVLLRDAGKEELEREMSFFEENMKKSLERAAWFHRVMESLDEKKKVRDQVSAEDMTALRQKFGEEWKGEVTFFTSEASTPIKKLTIEAIQKSQGDWMLALQLLTKRVLEDPLALFSLTSPVFFSALWQVFGQVSEHSVDMSQPLNFPLSSGWIFGDATREELKQEVLFWEENARFLLRKLRWFSLIRDAVGENGRVYKLLSELHVKKFWNDAFVSVR